MLKAQEFVNPEIDKKSILWDFNPEKDTYKYKNPLEEDVKEWRKSAIDETLIDLNLISLPSYVKDEKRKRVAYPFLDLLEVKYKDLLNAQQKLDGFSIGRSWTYKGYDPLSMQESLEYEIKVVPDLRKDYKYENPDGRVFFKLPKISNLAAKKIFPQAYSKIKAKDFDKEAVDFWQRVFDSDKPIIFTEGYKKSLSLLSHGFIGIGLRGACRGFNSDDKQNIDLSDEVLKLLSLNKRDYYVSFDTDQNQHVREVVQNFTYNFAKYLDSSKYSTNVAIIDLPLSELKAADDYIYAKGIESYKKLFDNALTLEEYKNKHKTQSLVTFFQNSDYDYNWCFHRYFDRNSLEKIIENDLAIHKFGDVQSYKYKKPEPEAYREWESSSIDPNLIDLNLISIPDVVFDKDGFFETLPFFDIANLDKSVFIEEYDIPITESVRKIWTYQGYNLAGEPNKEFEFKIQPPYREDLGKYEHTSEKGSIVLAKVSNEIARKIFPLKYIFKRNVDNEAKDFWTWVFDSNKPIIVTEGQKKALALLSHGFISISVSQTCLGLQVNSRAGTLEIMDDFSEILKRGKRDFYFSFDNDKDDFIRKIVISAQKFLAEAVENSGSKAKFVLLPDARVKGVDDYLYSKSFTSYKKLMDSALTLEELNEKFKEDIRDYFEKNKSEHNLWWCFERNKGKSWEAEIKNDPLLTKAKFGSIQTYKYKKPLAYAVKEWQESAIADDLIDLNLISIPDLVLDKEGKLIAYPFLDIYGLDYQEFFDKFDISDSVSEREIWTYSSYAVDGVTENPHFEFKPTKEFRNYGKYERSSNEAHMYLAKVSNRVAKIIFPDKYSTISKQEDSLEAEDFWKNVFESDVPIYVTEGQKKALSLLSHGFVGISIHSSFFGITVDTSQNEPLVYVANEFQEIIDKNKRDFFITFDRDQKKFTRELVYSIINFVGDAIEKTGSRVKVILLPSLKEKGVDDYLKAYSKRAFLKLKNEALSIKEFKMKYPFDFQDHVDEYKVNKNHVLGCFSPCQGKCMMEKK